MQAMVRREVNLALATSGAGGDYQIELLTQFFCTNSSQLGCSSKSLFGKWGFSHIQRQWEDSNLNFKESGAGAIEFFDLTKWGIFICLGPIGILNDFA